MSGTKAGGEKAARKNKQYDPDFYKKIGRAGGKISRGGGFAFTGDPDEDQVRRVRASAAGAEGGRNSHRGPVVSNYDRLPRDIS